jgi:hypothetical protein
VNAHIRQVCSASQVCENLVNLPTQNGFMAGNGFAIQNSKFKIQNFGGKEY